ncbi:MAG: valine--tRNA ligase [Candidatus Kapabacteria bacterium]|nr:valine--tRNA ligase [Candidatus Kapabacteria bacterium]
MQQELEKQYNPATVESGWYAEWMKNNIYAFPDTAESETYTVLMPPPNVTGMLTMGHVLNHTIQDLYIRYNRKNGKQAAWFPGLDHAGIATQTKVEQMLRAEEGISRRDLGREKFVERVYEWKEKYGTIILEQLRSLGNSCDWNRTLFTMDEGASNAVRDVFIRLFDEGLIYRGKRIINWSPAMQSAISDDEVIMKEVHDKMYTLKYMFEDGETYMSVATVRPETIFGDVAVAVNPRDERYAAFVGKMVRVPLTDRYVPVIADDYVETDFGTGCLKITPAHDPNDFEVGMRHNLPVLVSIDQYAVLNEVAGAYAGLERFDARKKIASDLEAAGLIVKVEDYLHKVGFSERGGEAVEPYYSDQWFVKMQPLAEPALAAVQNGDIRFYPDHWTKTYQHWMLNVRDWCISRQLWWGHRIPVYYTPDGNFTAARTEEEARTKLGLAAGIPLTRDEDSLDTWFSSWLWMLTTMRWQEDGETEDNEILRSYLPTDLLVTGPDIIFFWVARMIMASLHFKKTIPFKHVYFTSIIRDGDGRKMSKSLGNSPDPLFLFKKYGADAVRYTTLYLAPLGTDVKITVTDDNGSSDAPQMEFGRNFANKIWNAARFLMMKAAEAGSSASAQPLTKEQLSVSDEWILSRYHTTIKLVHENLADYRITEYTRSVYDFIWKDFCDWYVEIMKVQFASNGDAAYRQSLMRFALEIFEGALGLLHPVMPFITEEIWHKLGNRSDAESISLEQFTPLNEQFINQTTEKNFETVQNIIEQVRMMKAQANIKPSEKLPVVLVVQPDDADFYRNVASVIASLTRNELPEIRMAGDEKPEGALSSVVRGVDVYLIAASAIDVEKERARLEKEIERLMNLKRSAEAKLANEKFVANAKPDLVENERNKLNTAIDGITKIEETLKTLV